MSHSILLLPGDGIGPEVVAQARRVLERAADLYKLTIELDEANLGGVAIDREGQAYPESTQAKARSAAALLLGAVGGPQWDGLPAEERPERGLLAIRADLDLFANLRPAILFPQLADACLIQTVVAQQFGVEVSTLKGDWRTLRHAGLASQVVPRLQQA